MTVPGPAPDEIIVCNVPSSLINFVPSGVPVAKLAIGIIPVIPDAGRLVNVLFVLLQERTQT